MIETLNLSKQGSNIVYPEIQNLKDESEVSFVTVDSFFNEKDANRK